MTSRFSAKSKSSGWRSFHGVHALSIDRADFAIESFKEFGKDVFDKQEKSFRDRIFFRSRMEANYARYLEYLQLWKDSSVCNWLYEPCRFNFQFDVKQDGEIVRLYRSNFDYVPDFLVLFWDKKYVFLEIKGVMDRNSQTKINRMRKHFPEINLDIVTKVEYKKAADLARVRGIPWETV